MNLNICHLYPDIMNFSGDHGNVTFLEKRLLWREMEVSVTLNPIGMRRDLSAFDLFFIGGGKHTHTSLIEDLQAIASELRSLIDDGKVFLTISEGFELMAYEFTSSAGISTQLTGILDMKVEAKTDRAVGNCAYEFSDDSLSTTIIAFENHSPSLILGSELTPLARIAVGEGNRTGDSSEGVRYKNFYGCHGHGPLLSKNPAFADFLLKKALERKYGAASLPPLDDSFELSARNVMLKGMKLREVD